MTWKEKTVIRILLLVARVVCDEQWVQEEIKHLNNYISTELFFHKMHRNWERASRCTDEDQ